MTEDTEDAATGHYYYVQALQQVAKACSQLAVSVWTTDKAKSLDISSLEVLTISMADVL